MQCAACLPSCPTYQATKNESYSPRGRLALIKAYVEGNLEDTSTWAASIDSCLSCGACEQACPPKVKYHEIFTKTRALRTQKKTYHLSPKQRLFSFILTHTWIKRGLGYVGSLLPQSCSSIVPKHHSLKSDYSVPASKKTIHLLVDCALGTFSPEVFDMAAFVLNTLGYSVKLIRLNGCCGGWWEHIGETEKQNKALSTLEQHLSGISGPLTLYTLTSGCHQFLLNHLSIPTESLYTLISQIWEETSSLPTLASIEGNYIFHTPCTNRDQKGAQAYIKVLQQIPALSISTLPPGCCGAGGAMSTAYPKLADSITQRRFSTRKLDTVITFNTSCRLQIEKVCHPMKVLEGIYPLAKSLGYPK